MAKANSLRRAGSIVVLDRNGGYVKAGLASEAAPSVVEPNCTAVPRSADRLVAGAGALELQACALRRPTRRGRLLDLKQQRTLWDAVLRRRLGLGAGGEHGVLVTQAPFTPASVRAETEELLLESFGFKEVFLLPGPPLALYNPGVRALLDAQNPCCTVLDPGFSGSVALPCLEGRALDAADQRLSVAGRVLTNLSERMKLRHYDFSKSCLVAEGILTKAGEVSADFDADLRSRIEGLEAMTHVLPDFRDHRRGFLEEAPVPPRSAASPPAAAPQAAPAALAALAPQRVTLAAERRVVPEALFSPADHGLRQAGVAEVVRQAVLAVPDAAWRPHFGQVGLCGGVARLPGLRGRLATELRELLRGRWASPRRRSRTSLRGAAPRSSPRTRSSGGGIFVFGATGRSRAVAA